MTRHLLDLDDLGPVGISQVLSLCNPPTGLELKGRSAAMIFEKPSVRTRNSTEMAVVDLFGHAVMITDAEVGIDRRESAEDVARTLGCFHRVVAARVNDHGILLRMRDALEGQGADVSVINLLSDYSHPCQGLADGLTLLEEFGRSLAGRRLAYVGDANNVTISLAQVALSLGVDVTVAAPSGYQLSSDALDSLGRFGAHGGGTITLTADPLEAATGADVLYTDVWTSMGQEREREQRLVDLAGYCLDASLLEVAASTAIVLHCLPAHRGEEITDEVLESPASRVWAQAANRRTAMRGVLRWLVAGDDE